MWVEPEQREGNWAKPAQEWVELLKWVWEEAGAESGVWPDRNGVWPGRSELGLERFQGRVNCTLVETGRMTTFCSEKAERAPFDRTPPPTKMTIATWPHACRDLQLGKA